MEKIIELRIEEAFLMILSSHRHVGILEKVIGILVNVTSHSVGRAKLLEEDVNRQLLQLFAKTLRRLTLSDVNIALRIFEVSSE